MRVESKEADRHTSKGSSNRPKRRCHFGPRHKSEGRHQTPPQPTEVDRLPQHDNELTNQEVIIQAQEDHFIHAGCTHEAGQSRRTAIEVENTEKQTEHTFNTTHDADTLHPW